MNEASSTTDLAWARLKCSPPDVFGRPIGEVSVNILNGSRFLHLPDISKTWGPGLIYENHRLGTRVGRLLLFGANQTTLFEKDAKQETIAEFLRAFEDNIRSGKLRALGLVSCTDWHTAEGEQWVGRTEELSRKILSTTGDVTICKLPENTSPENILDNVPLDAVVLKSFSKEFRDALEKETGSFVQMLGREILRHQDIVGKKEWGEVRFGSIRIAPTPFHKDVGLFSVTSDTARATIMVHNDEISLQSFTASKRNLVELLSSATFELAANNIRIPDTGV